MMYLVTAEKRNGLLHVDMIHFRLPNLTHGISKGNLRVRTVSNSSIVHKSEMAELVLHSTKPLIGSSEFLNVYFPPLRFFEDITIKVLYPFGILSC